MLQGTVKWFDNQRGFGFITQKDNSDVFVHYSEINGTGHKTLNEGDVVNYEIGEGKKGPAAVNVTAVTSMPSYIQN